MAAAAPIGDVFARLTSAAPSTVTSNAAATVTAISTVTIAQSTSTSSVSKVPTGVFVWTGPAPTFSGTSIIYAIPSFQTEFPASSSLGPDVLPGPPFAEAHLVERGVCQPPACTPLHPAQYPPVTVTQELEFNLFPTPAIGKRGESAESAHVGAPHFVVTIGGEHVDPHEHVAHAHHSDGDSAENAHIGVPAHTINGNVSAESAHVSIAAWSHVSGTSAENARVGAPVSESSHVVIDGNHIIGVPNDHHIGPRSIASSPKVADGNYHIGVPSHLTGTSAEYAHLSVIPGSLPSGISVENAHIGAPTIDTLEPHVAIDGKYHISAPGYEHIGPRSLDSSDSGADGNFHIGVPTGTSAKYAHVNVSPLPSGISAENARVGAPGIHTMVSSDGNYHIGVPSIGPRAIDTAAEATADGNWHIRVPPTADDTEMSAENGRVGAPHMCEIEECHVSVDDDQ
ncbi:MAG: hypothetical protein Q9209_001490 [Squamulea sp. 1 TL-2023]